MSDMNTAPLLSVRNLVKHFPVKKGILQQTVGTVYAVDGINFDIAEGETLGLVGESGCGKSTTLLEVLNLKAPTGGEIEVLGEPVADMKGPKRKAMRRNVQVVFQDPMASLDPRMPVFDLIAEPMGVFNVGKEEIETRVNELLRLVGLEPSHADRYPQQFS